MATSAPGLSTGTITVNLFSGARTALPPAANPLLTIRNGNQQNVSLPNNGFVNASSISIGGLPFFNNFGDNYAVVASASGYQQAGFFPVIPKPVAPAIVDIMLLGKQANYNFRNATWARLNQNFRAYADLLNPGGADNAEVADRYSQLMERQSAVLGCYLNLVTAMAQINLPVKTPLFYIKEVIWEEMTQDRLFAWADPALVDQVAQAAEHGEFSPEVGTAVFHEGATRSWKQVQFGEANVQLTFHENDKKTIGGVECIKVEPDIDYFKDLLAHALIEVATNKLTGKLTDPRHVYVLRWIAGRHAGVADFEPPYTIE